MDVSNKLVNFGRFCSLCVEKDTEITKEPCNSCMEVNCRYGTEQPDRFKPTKEGEKYLKEHGAKLAN